MAKPGYAQRRAAERAERIARARRNLRQRSLSAGSRAPVSRWEGDRVIAGFTAALGVALVGHAGVAFAGFLTTPARMKHADAPVKVQVVMAPEPKPAAAPQEATVIPPQPIPVLAPRPRPKPEHRQAPAPAAAVNDPTPEPVAIVGLTLESTSSSGAGPSFAVGQTLAGSTARIAAAARAQDHNPLPLARAPVLPPSRNERAAPRAAAGVRVEAAQRLARIEPEYPPLLERQGIEADVTVRVQIAADGRLLGAELVRGAAETAFNEAALVAARRERFSPETHDGRAVETSLTYTYRFRITP